jgi:hypothetical protein
LALRRVHRLDIMESGEWLSSSPTVAIVAISVTLLSGILTSFLYHYRQSNEIQIKFWITDVFGVYRKCKPPQGMEWTDKNSTIVTRLCKHDCDLWPSPFLPFFWLAIWSYRCKKGTEKVWYFR